MVYELNKGIPSLSLIELCGCVCVCVCHMGLGWFLYLQLCDECVVFVCERFRFGAILLRDCM